VGVIQANNEEPRRWKLKDALKVKAGMSDREIDQLLETQSPLTGLS